MKNTLLFICSTNVLVCLLTVNMKNCLTPQNPKTCDPILVTPLKMRPHYSHSSRENATPWGEQGWHSGESTRLPPVWPRFKSWRRCHMWFEFVVGSLPCFERFFSRYSGFPLSLKTNTFKFQFDLERTDTFQRVLMNSLVLRG